MALGESRAKMNTAQFSDHSPGMFGLGREGEKNHLCLVNGANMMLKRESIQAPRCHFYNCAVACDLVVPSTKGSQSLSLSLSHTHTHTHTLQCGCQGNCVLCRPFGEISHFPIFHGSPCCFHGSLSLFLGGSSSDFGDVPRLKSLVQIYLLI